MTNNEQTAELSFPTDYEQLTADVNGFAVRLNFPKGAESHILDEVKQAILAGAAKA